MAAKTSPVILPANSPLLPARNRTREIAWALKGLAGGAADKGQQAMLIGWIVRDLCGTYDMPYRPDSQRDTDFAAGKMHVGQELVKLINMTPDQILALPSLGPSGRDDGDPGAMQDM